MRRRLKALPTRRSWLIGISCPYPFRPRFSSQTLATNSSCSSPRPSSSPDSTIKHPVTQKHKCSSDAPLARSQLDVPSPTRLAFWTSQTAWKRARVNTLRCLVGCTLGDFSMLWLLQTYFPLLGTTTIMAASMTSGIATSIILETVLLRRGVDQLSWPVAAKTAMGMSLVSMLAMEFTENMVDYHLTGGVVTLNDPFFWFAAALSISAGFLVPLPYNYFRLRKHGKACH